jgi:predicted metalloprotease with PDZ domain
VLAISHVVSLADPKAHLLRIKTLIRASGGQTLPSPLIVFMPVWTPGSYLVREYARHVEKLKATSNGEPLEAGKIRKNAWRVEHRGATAVEVEYQLYANELTVRTNHVDESHAYWNGAATFLAIEQAPGAGARVTIELPAQWEVATALASDERETSRWSFVAATFDELCDAPFECGNLVLRSFSALGKAHRIAAADGPDARGVDWDKLAADTKTIVETEARLFAGERSPEDALPYDRYLFLWHVTPRARGGLEHRDSATLMARPSSFQTRSGYLDVLSLVAHEYFHLWNVKRIRPQGLSPYLYEHECYTRLLWWFEGATSYYDWRTLRLAKLCTVTEYLNHLAEEMVRLLDTPGALVSSLEEASFDAWIKAYRPDENSLNSTVSYYLKGEIVCMLFDLTIRHRTAGRVSLDDVLRHLYWEFGAREAPVPEAGLPDLFAKVAGVSLDDCFSRWVRGTEPLDIDDTLAKAGLRLERSPRRDGPPASLSVRLKLDGGRTVVEAVPRGGAAHRAGIDARDEIVAVAGRRVPEGKLELPLSGLSPGQTVPVLVARDGWMRTVELTLDSPPLPEAKIVARADADDGARQLYEAWMGEPLGA